MVWQRSSLIYISDVQLHSNCKCDSGYLHHQLIVDFMKSEDYDSGESQYLRKHEILRNVE